MTRDEAINAVSISWKNKPGTIVWGLPGEKVSDMVRRMERESSRLVDDLSALGILKLDEPKQSDRVGDALELICSTPDFSYGSVSDKIDRLRKCLDLAGLRIVEK